MRERRTEGAPLLLLIANHKGTIRGQGKGGGGVLRDRGREQGGEDREGHYEGHACTCVCVCVCV